MMLSTGSLIKCKIVYCRVPLFKRYRSQVYAVTYILLWDCKQLVININIHEQIYNVLHNRGYNIGVRLIEDLIAKGNVGRCHDLRETADIIAKVC